MRNSYKTAILTLLLAGVSFVFFSSLSTGPGAGFMAGYTGAPFDNSGDYCSNCHGGGSFTPSVMIQLLDANSAPVTTYLPGASYTVHIEVSSSTGVTSNTRYGFQVMSAENTGNSDIGSWGPIPLDYHSVLINGRTYVEHSDRLASGIIDIPWTAPTAGAGGITFYAAGNVVNFDMSSSGDNPTTNTLTVTQTNLPLTWLYFRGKEDKGAINLEWATTGDIVKGEFLLEKSTEGKVFQYLGESSALTTSEATHKYLFRDEAPLKDNFYRISVVDVSGQKNTFQIIHIASKLTFPSFAYVDGNEIIILLSEQGQRLATVELTSLDGRILGSKEIMLSAGANKVKLDKPGIKGVYFIRAVNGRNILFQDKVLVD
jgi:hypothetical protein